MTEKEMQDAEDFAAMCENAAFRAECDEARERYADYLIDQGREDEPVEGMPAWWFKELYGAANEEESSSSAPSRRDTEELR